MARETRLDLIEGLEQRVEGFFVSLLRSGEPTLVDAVVDGVVDDGIHPVDLGAQIGRIGIDGRITEISKARLSIRIISDDSLLTTVPVRLSHKTGTVTWPV